MEKTLKKRGIHFLQNQLLVAIGPKKLVLDRLGGSRDGFRNWPVFGLPVRSAPGALLGGPSGQDTLNSHVPGLGKIYTVSGLGWGLGFRV